MTYQPRAKRANREIGVPGLTTEDLETLQTRTFYGKEKKSLDRVPMACIVPPEASQVDRST